MAVSFACPKCSQKLTLSASKPGDWLDCPSCEASIQVPGTAPAPRPAPKPPARDAAPPVAAPKPPPRPKPAPVPAAPAPKKWWADRRVLLGAGGALALVAGVAVALALRKPAEQEQAKSEPPPPVIAPTPTPTPTPAPKPAPNPKPLPPQANPMKPDPKPAPQQPIDPPKTTQPQQPPQTPQTGVALAPPPRKARDYPPPLLVEAEAPLDQFGNPIGKDQGLARQDEFKGQSIVFWAGCKATADEDRVYFSDKNPLWKALGDKGFTVRREFGKFDPKWLKTADQFWILSGDATNALGVDGVIAVTDFVDAGKGLLLLADNDPFTVEADVLALSLFGAGVVGDYEGTKIAHVRGRKLTPAEIKKFGGGYAVDDHPLLTGVNFVYEGNTVSHVKIAKAKDLEVALRASDGKPVVAVSTDPKKRVVIDCGFTRYFHSADDQDNYIEKTAGTVRLAQNIAAYLAGKDAPKKP